MADKSNPPGFDIYVSDDGKRFEPYTVNGLGDPTNYGGRVLVPSEHGFYSTTANPFAGGQVWRLDNMKPGLFPNGPSEIVLEEGGEAAMTVLVNEAPDGRELTLSYDSDIVGVSLVKRGEPKYPTDFSWNNKIIKNRLTGKKHYEVEETERGYKTEMYDIYIRPLKRGTQNLVLDFECGGAAVSRTVAVNVDIPYVPDGPVIRTVAELRAALVNKSVGEIVIGNDITAPRIDPLLVLNHSVDIYGQGATLDLGSHSIDIKMESDGVLNVKNLSMKSSNRHGFFTAYALLKARAGSWTIGFENIKFEGSALAGQRISAETHGTINKIVFA
jgi:hypothetical protein